MDEDARYPVVTVGGNGSFYVAWQHTPVGGSGSTGIWVNRYIPGSSWSGPLQISTGTTAANVPAIAADGSGNAIVTWHQANASAFLEVQASRLAVSSGWSAPTILGTSAAAHNFAPYVAMDPAGNGMVTWNRATNTATGIYAVCAVPYRTGLGWQVPASIPSLQAGVDGFDDAYGAAVAMSAGGAVVGWAESVNGAVYRPFARVWNPTTGTWSAAATVAGTQDASNPEVGIDASGKVHAAWMQFSGTDWIDLYVGSYAPGGTFSVSSQPVEALTGGIGYLSLQVTPAGSAALVWNQMNGPVANIYGLHFDPSRGWGAPALLETDDSGFAYAPVVRLSTNGQAFATWYQKDASGLRHIYANRWN
jgi:hypothetical protein